MFRHSVLSLALVTIVASGAAAQTTIRVATQAPVNSSYHKTLLDLGAEWEAKTSGRVKLTVYAGGTQGSEEATLRMMRAATLGLSMWCTARKRCVWVSTRSPTAATSWRTGSCR